MRYVPIAGTFGWRGIIPTVPIRDYRWWERGSLFSTQMIALGHEMLDADQPFIWTTNLDGVEFWRRFLVSRFFHIPRTSDHIDWMAGAENLLRYLASVRGPVDYVDCNLITHSHGGQVVFYAASFGLRIRRLITIGTPERADMFDVLKIARPNIEYWAHIYDQNLDNTSTLGEFGDDVIRHSKRDFDIRGLEPSTRIAVPSIDHSRILEDPERISYWATQGWADLLR